MRPLERPPNGPSKVIGTPAAGAPAIHVPRLVLEAVVNHSRSGLPNAVGGYLVGNWCVHEGRERVDVEGYIPAILGRGSRSGFTFTGEAARAAFETLESEWPGSRLAGWHCARPGAGIFLSSADLGLHDALFPEPWQIVLIVDPSAGTLGFFARSGGRPAATGFHLVE